MEEKLKEAETLLKDGKKSRHSGDVTACIKSMTRAITIYCKLQDQIDFNHHLFEAYCLRAFSRQEIQPSSKEIYKDLKTSLNLWQKIYKDGDIDEELFKLESNTIVLLFNVIDLSQIKGFIELSKDACQVALDIFKLEKIKVEKWVPLLQQSQRLKDHALCVSYVDETFYKNLGFEKLDAWKAALKENECSLQEFLQNAYFPFIGSHNDTLNFTAISTFEKVQSLAKTLETKARELTTKASDSIFVAENMYLETSKRILANGELHEALLYAKKADDLIESVFEEIFYKNYEPADENIAKIDQSKNLVEVKKKVIKEVFCLTSKSGSIGEHYYLSPWKVMQSYLECTHQIGIVNEALGNESDARYYFNKGKSLSDEFDLPMFRVTFSLLLGKIFLKSSVFAEKEKLEELCGKARSELEFVENILNGKTFSCLKCIKMLKVTLNKDFGNLLQMPISTCDKKKARNKYVNALKLLKENIWKNPLSCPDGIVGEKCVCNEVDQNSSTSWHCLSFQANKFGSLENLINLKWEYVRRKMSLEVQIELARLYENCDQKDEERNILLNGISVLVDRNPFINSFTHMVDDCVVEIQGDIFAIERAQLIYNICWYCLRHYNYGSELNRKLLGNNIGPIEIEDIAAWLREAFVLSCEVPQILQKVSRLLTIIYALPVGSSGKKCSVSPLAKDLSENYWCSYFHQISIAPHDAYEFRSRAGRVKVQCSSGSFSKSEDTSSSLGFVPKSTEDLKDHVEKFLVGHSTATIINITILGPSYTAILQRLPLPNSPPDHTNAWMIVSRLCFETQPIAMLFPLNSIPRDEIDLSRYRSSNGNHKWSCPWNGVTVLDDIAPSYRALVEENFFATFPEEKRRDLDERFDKLLRNLEDLWFGPWKWVLLGELLDSKKINTNFKEVVANVRKECNLKINKNILKLFLGAGKYDCEGKTPGSELWSKKYCYIAGVGYVGDAYSGILPIVADNHAHQAALRHLKKALSKLDVDNDVNRKPVILVLDCEVQMFPWETFPILRRQEIYRMPTVHSIFANLENGSFCSIDPLDAYYLLSPEDDQLSPDDQDQPHNLKGTEDFFKHHKLQGTLGYVPSLNKLTSAMEKHDLFIYMGHGCGSQIIPRTEVDKLQKSPAVFLLGCESGACVLEGNYAPFCTPISYLLVGSPFVVATLWTSTDLDLDKFIRSMFESMLKSRSCKCKKCKEPGETRKLPQKKLGELSEINCRHRRSVGALMPDARNSLSLMLGACLVCFGVPTNMCIKNNVKQESNKRRKSF